MGSDEIHFKYLINCGGQSHKTVFTEHNFSRERGAEAESNRGPSAYQPNAFPLSQAGSLIPGKVALGVLNAVHKVAKSIKSPSPPNLHTPPLLPVPNKPYGFCGR